MKDVSTERKLKAVVRELALRLNVYPKWVRSGRMKRADAVEGIVTFVAIAQDYGGKGMTGEEFDRLLADKGLAERAGDKPAGDAPAETHKEAPSEPD